MIKQDPKSAELIKPVLRGKDIQKYQHNWENTRLWLIATFPALKIDIARYPAIKKYLLSFGKKRLEQTGARFPDGTKSRKKTTHAWYELQDTCAYHEEFLHDKIVYPNMTKFLPFAYDQDGFYANDKSFIVTGKSNLKYLTGYLNSIVSAKWIYENCPKLGDNRRELRRVFFENIPIPVPNEKEEVQIISLVNRMLSNQKHLSQTKTRHDEILVKERIDKIDKQINRIFYRLYGLTSKEISLVEKQSS